MANTTYSKYRKTVKETNTTQIQKYNANTTQESYRNTLYTVNLTHWKFRNTLTKQHKNRKHNRNTAKADMDISVHLAVNFLNVRYVFACATL